MVTFQFSTEASLGSWAIRVYCHGWCSHVDCVLPDGRLLGARSDGGVLIRPPNYAPFSRTQRVTLPATDEQTDAFHAFLQAQVGKKYDMTAIVAFAFDRDWREDDSWFCSELQAAALEAAKIVHPLSTPANKIYPAALLFMSSALAI